VTASTTNPGLGDRLFASPHRVFFAGGLLQLLLVMVVWTTELAGRLHPALAVPLHLPPLWVHLFLMVYGTFPFFIFGFLFTVFPRWLGGPPIARRQLIAVSALLGAGQLLFYVGAYRAGPTLIAALGLILAGWAAALVALLRVHAVARQRGQHEPLLELALAGGLAGVAAYLAAVASGSATLFAVARELGLWLFLVPVVFLVAHRMIPVFSQGTLMDYLMVRPAWAPPLMLACAAGHAALDLAGLAAWRWLADLPLTVAALHLSWVWQFRRSFHARLLAMLHVAFLWLGIAMLLYTLQGLALLVTGTDPLGRAPLHALGIGFFTGMIVAMASRVMLGHSGRPLAADRLTWLALLGIDVAALVRIAAELWPVWGTGLNLLAGLAWLAALLPWVAHYLPMTLRPRVDGQPG
jgi:uncharacterized protein involved in response to NO